MKRTLTIGLALGLLAAGAASADIKAATASGTKSPTFNLAVVGQAVITIMWTKKNADLDAGVFCPDESGFPTLVAGAASASDRIERIEFGLVDPTGCFLGVAAFTGKSKFTASVFSSDGFGFAKSPARVVDSEGPATERSAAIEQLLAFKRRQMKR